jgi:hypothetical protein
MKKIIIPAETFSVKLVTDNGNHDVIVTGPDAWDGWDIIHRLAEDNDLPFDDFCNKYNPFISNGDTVYISNVKIASV